MTYTAIADTRIDPDSPLDTSLFTDLRDNPIAIAAGDAGAPEIQAAAMATDSVDGTAIAAGAVSQGELNTDSGTGTNTGGIVVREALPGGAYGFMPRFRYSNSGTSTGWALPGWAGGGAAPGSTTISSGTVPLTTGYVSYVTTYTSSGSGEDIDWQQHFVDASPPYVIGDDDGEVPIFVFLRLERGTGKILGIWCSRTPPWAHNGPTQIRPHGTDHLGRPFRWATGKGAEAMGLARQRKGLLRLIRQGRPDLARTDRQLHGAREALRGLEKRAQRAVFAPSAVVADLHRTKATANDLRQAAQAIRADTARAQRDLAAVNASLAALAEPITMAQKMADMPLLPTPWLGLGDDVEVVLLDPPSTAELLDIHYADDPGNGVSEMLRRGDIRIHNDDLTRATPPGVRAVRWSKR